MKQRLDDLLLISSSPFSSVFLKNTFFLSTPVDLHGFPDGWVSQHVAAGQRVKVNTMNLQHLMRRGEREISQSTHGMLGKRNSQPSAK